MARWLLAVAVLAVAVASVHGMDQGTCMSASSARNSTEFGECVSHIRAQPFSSDQITALKDCLKRSHRGFDAHQVATLLSLFSFSSDQITVLGLLNPYILGMNCSQAAHVLEGFSFSGDQLTALKNLVNVSAIVQPQTCNETIGAVFSFTSDRNEALDILAHAVGRSCLYGDITVKTAVFVVDTSGSMATSFTTDGKTYTRLDYVKMELKAVVSEQLRSWQYFNILRFSGSVSSLWKAPRATTSANAQEALQYIEKWQAGGGTNAYQALVDAYGNSGVEAVYFLSDGAPSVGITNPGDIESEVASLSQGGKVVCNTIAFVEGGSPSDKAQAQAFMSALARVSGGVYRSMGSASS